MVLPLEGIRVVDMGGLGPGAMAAMMLGDLGADVIRVDMTSGEGGVGSGISYFPPGEAGERLLAHSPMFRNKRNLALNLKSDEGQEIFRRLAGTADVLIEGFRPGVMDRMNIGYEALSKVNPRLIYCAITGFGQMGPYRDMPGHDAVFTAMGGAQALIGENAETAPVIPQTFVADLAIGWMETTVGILAALWARQHTGRGQMVDISLMDGVVSLLPMITGAHSFLADGQVPRRGEMLASGRRPYYATYRTRDGKYLTITPVEPKFWRNLCRALGREDLVPLQYDPTKQDYLRAELGAIFLTRTRDEWFDLLGGADVGVGKVLELDEIFADPHVLSRGMVLELDHPKFGKVRHVGFGLKLSETPPTVRRLPRPPGADTEEILLEAGYARKEIEEFRRQGVI